MLIDVGNVAALLQSIPGGLTGPLRVHVTGAADGDRVQCA